MTEYRFNYKKYKNKNISTDLLDKAMESIISKNTGTFASIISGAKIVIFFCYLYARKELIEKEMLIEKQEYEQQTNGQTTVDIEGDNLD